MILEIATFDILADKTHEFEVIMPKAIAVISQSQGFIKINFKKCIEKPNIYYGLIEWETLENHTVGFRESELFLQWRAIISPFFNNPPSVLHFENVLGVRD